MSPALPHGSCMGSPAPSPCPIPGARGSGHGSAGTWEQHGHREGTQPCSGASRLKTTQQNIVCPCKVASSAGCGPRARDIPVPPTSEAGDKRGGVCRSPFLPVAVFWSKCSSARVEGSVTAGGHPLCSPPHTHPRDTLHPGVTSLAAAQPLSPPAPNFPTACGRAWPCPSLPRPLGSPLGAEECGSPAQGLFVPISGPGGGEGGS